MVPVPGCLSEGFYCFDETPGPKGKLRRKGFILLTLQHHCFSLKESGQELEQDRIGESGADAEAVKGAVYWLAPHLAQPAFL